MICRILLCALLWQLLASEHSCVLKQEFLLRLHHISPIVSTQQFRGVQWQIWTSVNSQPELA